MSESRRYHTMLVVTLTLNLDVCQNLLLTNKNAYTQCRKNTNSVVKSSCKFIYLFICILWGNISYSCELANESWEVWWWLFSWSPGREIFHLWAEHFSCCTNGHNKVQNQNKSLGYLGTRCRYDILLISPTLKNAAYLCFLKCISGIKYISNKYNIILNIIRIKYTSKRTYRVSR